MTSSLDQLDYMLYRHRQYARTHTDEDNLFEGDGSDFELGIYIHQLITNGQIEVLQELRTKFKEPDGSVASIGPLWDMAVSADVKAIHKTIDDTISEIKGETMKNSDSTNKT